MTKYSKNEQNGNKFHEFVAIFVGMMHVLSTRSRKTSVSGVKMKILLTFSLLNFCFVNVTFGKGRERFLGELKKGKKRKEIETGKEIKNESERSRKEVGKKPERNREKIETGKEIGKEAERNRKETGKKLKQENKSERNWERNWKRTEREFRKKQMAL